MSTCTNFDFLTLSNLLNQFETEQVFFHKLKCVTFFNSFTIFSKVCLLICPIWVFDGFINRYWGDAICMEVFSVVFDRYKAVVG